MVIVCGKPEFIDPHQDVVTNPAAIFEIHSPGTESFDRGQKFAEYRKLASLRHYVLVSQDRIQVDHYEKQADGLWLLRPLDHASDRLRLSDWDVELELASQIYDGVDWDPEPDSGAT